MRSAVLRRCWHTHGWISSSQLPPQLSSCCCSGPPPYAALSLCWDFPVTLALDLPVSPPACTASQGIPLLRSSLGLSHQCYPLGCSLLASRRMDALGISSPSDLSLPCYCTLARETWDANNVSRLRHGVRNQDTWLLSRFRCSPDRQLWGSPVKTPLFCVALLSPTHSCRIGEHSQAHVIPCRHRTWQLRKSRAGN